MHGCFRLKNNPGIAKHDAKVYLGRLVAKTLARNNFMHPEDDFDEHDTEKDSFMPLKDLFEIMDMQISDLPTSQINRLRLDIEKAKKSFKLIMTFS